MMDATYREVQEEIEQNANAEVSGCLLSHEHG
jgi:hypothetical protein